MAGHYGRAAPSRFANRAGRGLVPVAMTATLPSPTATTPQPAPRRPAVALIAPALAGGAVALALGVYGRVHHATGRAIDDLGFPSLLAMKSWLATIAVRAGAVPAVVGAAHVRAPARAPDDAAVAAGRPPLERHGRPSCVSLPVAYHCLWSLGLATDRGPRPLIHGLLGCAFYGAIATKLLALRAKRLPRWAIPVVGATW